MDKLAIEKQFVEFYSPGTIVPETTTEPIDSWDIKKAIKMSREIKERHGATPYGFRFKTRGRREKDLDSKEIKRSGVYYLGGVILTLADVIAENDPMNDILISNMRGNKIKRVIRNNNSWRFIGRLNKEDIVLTDKELEL